MARKSSVLNGSNHPYSRSVKLVSDYRTIGTELLRYESGTRSYGYQSFSAFTGFREGVAFVSVEVLESYLEDLLDIDGPIRKSTDSSPARKLANQ